MKIFVLLSLLLFISSCSKKGETTSAGFKLVLSGISGLSNAGGGAMLWGKSSSGASFSVNLETISSDLELSLRNETWDFYTIAWNAPNNVKLSGDVSCASSTGNVLAGGEVQIDLNLSNANCSEQVFSPSTSSHTGKSSFPTLKLSSCSDLLSVTDISACTKMSAANNKGYLKSYEILLPEFIEGDTGEISISESPLKSACISNNLGSVGESLLGGSEVINIPLGNTHAPFRTIIRGYFAENCDETKGSTRDTYELGLYAPNHVGGQVIHGTLRVQSDFLNSEKLFTLHHLLSSENACNLSVSQLGDFAIGTGASDDPYGICSPEQFNSVGSDSTLLSSHFELLKDLDFGGYAAELDQVYSISCADIGTSMIPFGGLYESDCTTLIEQGGALTSFSGSFDGRYRTIRNAFIMQEDHNTLGIFRSLEGHIRNLKLVNIEVEGKTNIGIVAGYADGVNSGSITDVMITKGIVDGEGEGDSIPAKVGGMIGYMTSGFVFENNHANYMEVEAEGNYIGGLIGLSDGGSISSSSFTGKIEASSDHATVGYVGGIAGKLIGVDISESKSNGAIISNGSNIGGITGYLHLGNKVSNSYSLMSIFNTLDTMYLNIGGLVGEAGDDVNTEVLHSYFGGSIQTYCTYGPSCSIGQITGSNNTNTTITESISVGIDEALGGDIGINLDYSNLEDTNFFTNNAPSWDNTNIWKALPYSIPRLSWETPEHDPCLDPENNLPLSDQFNAGRGTLLNQLRICSPTQFKELKNYNLKYASIFNNINLHEYTIADASSNFTNQLAGRGFVLHNLSFPASDDFVGLFKNIGSTGTVKGINLINININNPANSYTGILAGVNQGSISDVNILGANISGFHFVGGITGINNGEIESTTLNWSRQISGQEYIGGIAGQNNGTISKVKSNGSFPMASNTENLGGITGSNEVTGKIQMSTTSSFIIDSIGSLSHLNIGGVVGDNKGVIQDVINTEYSMIDSQSSITNLGGITGQNSGSIERALHVGSIKSTNITFNNGPIAGADTGGSIANAHYASLPVLITPPSITETIDYTDFTTPNICALNMTAATSFIAGNEINIGGADKLYTVQSIAGGNVIINTTEAECNFGGISGLQVYKYNYGTHNSDGTYANSGELKTLAYYCNDTIPVPSDYNFRCSNGWDMIEDDLEGNGFNFLKEIFKAELYKERAPANSPTWVIEEGYSYPSLIFDW